MTHKELTIEVLRKCGHTDEQIKRALDYTESIIPGHFNDVIPDHQIEFYRAEMEALWALSTAAPEIGWMMHDAIVGRAVRKN